MHVCVLEIKETKKVRLMISSDFYLEAFSLEQWGKPKENIKSCKNRVLKETEETEMQSTILEKKKL